MNMSKNINKNTKQTKCGFSNGEKSQVIEPNQMSVFKKEISQHRGLTLWY